MQTGRTVKFYIRVHFDIPLLSHNVYRIVFPALCLPQVPSHFEAVQLLSVDPHRLLSAPTLHLLVLPILVIGNPWKNCLRPTIPALDMGSGE